MSRINNQIKLAQEMQVSGFNVVTCGHCGTVNIHRMSQEDIECWSCGYSSEPCDFPDYFYEGMPEQTNETSS